ncbi:restriction endonuclease [Streptomyces caniscabiei]|uniref:McrC family protein n=2 Tax=Streptomyces caniscabiei TaxID=2746961 RepID=UPI0029B66D9B|nr:restriction endonuclease [Streptomyces caniscabiei]MDX2606126.1 restriction endonuclease [Streptomyces caniscabiei]MDX2741878.1 restriction endonuclease [Streptomyces caniscabiei]
MTTALPGAGAGAGAGTEAAGAGKPAAPSLRLTVDETGPGTVRELTADQVAGLLSAPGAVRLTPAAGGRWRVAGKQKVGLVRLRTPAGEAIELLLRPKLPVRDLLFLLSHSPTDPWHAEREQVTAATADELLPALADLLARVARRTLEAGVLHGYRTVEEDLPLIRGRVRTADQLRRVGLPLPVAVRYDDHTPDIAENRLLLAALQLAARLPGVPARTRFALRHLGDHLRGVRLLHPGAPLPRWTPTRLNARYAPALRLAELLLSHRSVQPEGGAPLPTDGFLLDMPAVFERFLTVTLTAALARHGVRCAAQETHHRLDEAARVPFRPDLVLYRGGRPVSVADAKYAYVTPTAPPTSHLYQLLAYCTALGLPHGHLIYAAATPAADADPAPHVVRRSGITVTAHTLDLAAPPATLLADVTTLAERIAGERIAPGRTATATAPD